MERATTPRSDAPAAHCVLLLTLERQLTNDVWAEVNAQIGNYVGGKVVDGKTSKSSKLGAATGAVKGNQTKKACEQENAARHQRNEQRRAQAEQQAAATGGPAPGTADDYTRAYSVCLEAKGYTVK